MQRRNCLANSQTNEEIRFGSVCEAIKGKEGWKGQGEGRREGREGRGYGRRGGGKQRGRNNV